MIYEKIDVSEKNCMLFWKEHKDDIEYMHCGRSRYVKVINEYGAYVSTKVVMKLLRYMSVTPRLKQLYLSEKTMKQMRWHKEGKCDSEDPDVMYHPTDGESWRDLNRIYLELARDPKGVRLGLLTDGFQPHNTDSSLYSC
jgi:hypothetical protein